MSSGSVPDDVVHTDGCHCRRMRWRVEAPASVVAWICNCSDCSMRGNTHFVVPAAKFALDDPGRQPFCNTAKPCRIPLIINELFWKEDAIGDVPLDSKMLIVTLSISKYVSSIFQKCS